MARLEGEAERLEQKVDALSHRLYGSDTEYGSDSDIEGSNADAGDDNDALDEAEAVLDRTNEQSEGSANATEDSNAEEEDLDQLQTNLHADEAYLDRTNKQVRLLEPLGCIALARGSRDLADLVGSDLIVVVACR